MYNCLLAVEGETSVAALPAISVPVIFIVSCVPPLKVEEAEDKFLVALKLLLPIATVVAPFETSPVVLSPS